jgi:hypothetical protein
VGEDAGSKPSRCGTGNFAVEDELDLFGAAEVEIFADHLLEEQAARTGRSSTWVSENSACRIEIS